MTDRPVTTRTCTRCGLPGLPTGARWPEGFICRRCYERATSRRGRCPTCGETRLLPGLADDTPVCLDCAGIPVDLRCTRCHDEDRFYRRGLCAACCLSDDLAALLDDGSGRVHPGLVRFHAAVSGQPHPRSAIIWLRSPVVRGLLTDLAAGRVPLTHAGIDEYAPRTATAHLRELLVQCGALPRRNRDLVAFETWLAAKLTQITDPGQRRPIQRFATWHHLRRLRNLGRQGTLTDRQVHYAKQNITIAAGFLAWLADRGRTLTDCTPADIDAWLAPGPSTRYRARTFVTWAGRKGLMPRLSFPDYRAHSTRVSTQQERLQQLRRALTDQTIPTPYRVAAALLLLYAQPLTRICRLRVQDIAIVDGALTVHLGGHSPVPLPEPVATLTQQLLHERPNTNTAANQQSPWLFTGQRPGQPLHVARLMSGLRDRGIDLLGARNAALRQLVLDMPPALAAAALGYSPETAEHHAAAAGQPWADYAAVKRYRPSPP